MTSILTIEIENAPIAYWFNNWSILDTTLVLRGRVFVGLILQG